MSNGNYRNRTVRSALPEKGYHTSANAVVGSMMKGVLLVIDPAATDNYHTLAATAIGQGKFRGVQIDEGFLPNGAADPTVPDLVTAQKKGIAMARCPGGGSVSAEGDQAWCDASGKFITRTPFSFSGLILGQFDESFTTGANDEYHGVELYPQYIETVRSVTLCNTGAIGAATKYLVSGLVVPNAAQFPVYMARFTGETLRNLALTLKTAPGGSDTVVCTYMKSQDGGTTWADIVGPTLTITGAAKSGQDLSHTATLTAGDMVTVKLVSSAGTAAQPTATFDVA